MPPGPGCALGVGDSNRLSGTGRSSLVGGGSSRSLAAGAGGGQSPVGLAVVTAVVRTQPDRTVGGSPARSTVADQR